MILAQIPHWCEDHPSAKISCADRSQKKRDDLVGGGGGVVVPQLTKLRQSSTIVSCGSESEQHCLLAPQMQ